LEFEKVDMMAAESVDEKVAGLVALTGFEMVLFQAENSVLWLVQILVAY
jgi:hypothetical protein